MGYAMAYSPCFGCNRVFGYNPVSVPSINFDGTKEPICRSCVERVNPMREKNGLPPIAPLPDAYEAVEESCL